MKRWTLNPEYATGESGRLFADLDTVFALEGELITFSPISTVHKVFVGDRHYYVKRYTSNGKGIRQYFGRCRVQSEWKNLLMFHAWGIPSVNVAAFGLERSAGKFIRGALVTEELADTRDLAELANRDDVRLRDRKWVAHVSRQIAWSTNMMHDQGFTHNDLKWRNLLVNEAGKLFLIDCPSGDFWWGPILRHRIVKDLACLDKVARCTLSRTQRLRFFLLYRRRGRLGADDKVLIKQILVYFKGRE